MSSRSILLYGDINLNLVDGSAVWLASLAHVLGERPEFRADLLLKSDLKDPARLPDPLVRLISPLNALAHSSGLPGWARLLGRGLVTAANLPLVVAGLEKKSRYDLILVRGLNACSALVTRYDVAGRLGVYFTDIPHRFLSQEDTDYLRLARIITAAKIVFCQTEEFRNFLEAFFPAARGRCALLPPMVPDAFYEVEAHPEKQLERPTLLYAGKFAPDWGTAALFEIFERIQRLAPGTRLRVFGDKIHQEPGNPQFRTETLKQLHTGMGVEWVPRVNRTDLAQAYADSTIGYAMRDSALDDSLEMSTKVLEYGAASLPALLNRTRRHIELLGEDYPLFANTAEEACEAIIAVLRQPERLTEAARRCHEISLPHRFRAVGSALARALDWKLPASVSAKGAPRRIVVASHDLKFFGPLREHVLRPERFSVRYDPWKSLREHDPDASGALLADTDDVFCEWCAGNAVWYSHHVRPGQRLYIRFHRVEMNTEFPDRLNLDAVTRVVFVSEHMRQAALAEFGWPENKTAVIPNSVDAFDYDRKKSPWSRYNLGMVGFLPPLKRLDLAIDVIKRLVAHDPRFKLCVRGKLPWELDWMWKRQEHRRPYLDVFERISSDPALREAVVFDEFDTDMPRWFQKIGYVLSLSDIESFHLAAAEGMASGALPLILERDGARDLFPARWVFPTTEAIADAVRELDESPSRDELAGDCKSFVAERYDTAPVSRLWVNILETEMP